MERFFNIAGPCKPAKHYMLPAMARLPGVGSLIRKEQYFVVHAQRQCGKTTAFLELAKEINAKDDRVALYCSLEVANAFPKAADGIPIICDLVRAAAGRLPAIAADARLKADMEALPREGLIANGISRLLSMVSVAVGKPLAVFFDEADCLGEETLLTFLRQLRDGAISLEKGVDFPASIALIGMRDIRDYKARIRSDSESLGSASPFNVLTEAMSLRTFTDEEVAALYAQHTAETGQLFEPEAVRRACLYSGGQPYLVNALARWCVEKIHGERYGEAITAVDMHEAKEKIIREMALGKGALDLGGLFRGAKYAVEVKLKYNYEKNSEKAYDQVRRYMDHLGVPEGWLVVFDPDLKGDWDAKLSHADIDREGKRIHLFRC